MSQVTTINTLDDADKALKEIGEAKGAIDAANRALNKTVEAAQAAAKEQVEPLNQRVSELSSAVEAYIKANRDEVLGKKKSRAMNHGKVGFRTSTAFVPNLKAGWEAVLKRLEKAKEEAFIRIKKDVNKTAFKGLDKARLKELGVREETTESFFLEANAAEVKET